MNLNPFCLKNDEIILLSEESDRNYWSDRLGVSHEVLKSPVRATKSITLSQITAYLSDKISANKVA